MESTMLTWNIRNWVTVFLMFLAAWAVLGFMVRLMRGRVPQSTPMPTAESGAVFGGG